jgi:hypothetical protein
MYIVHWRKSTNDNEGKQEKILMRLSKQSLELASVFKEDNINFLNHFSLSQGSLKIAKPFAHAESTIFNLRPLRKIFIW